MVIRISNAFIPPKTAVKDLYIRAPDLKCDILVCLVPLREEWKEKSKASIYEILEKYVNCKNNFTFKNMYTIYISTLNVCKIEHNLLLI